MKDNTEEIKTEGHSDVLGEKQTHPAFGMIGISQGQGTGITLVGSAVRHRNCVTLTIKEASRTRDEYSEHYHGQRTLCAVKMSHAQLAEMLFNTNRGDGVPCTIQYAIGDKAGYRPEPPFESPMKKHSDDLSAALQKTLEYARELAAEAETLIITKNLKASDRERMRFLALKIRQDIEENMPYAMRCVDEKVEGNIAHAKSEIESFVNMTFKAAGIEHLQQEAPKLIEEDIK